MPIARFDAPLTAGMLQDARRSVEPEWARDVKIESEDPRMQEGTFSLVSHKGFELSNNERTYEDFTVQVIAATCPRCNEPMKVAVPLPPGPLLPAGQLPVREPTEEEQFLERLRLKVRANYANHEEMLFEFLHFLQDTLGSASLSAVDNSYVRKFLEWASNPKI